MGPLGGAGQVATDGRVTSPGDVLAEIVGEAGGAFDPLVNAFAGLRYQRDLSNVMIGAVPGYFLQAAQRFMGPMVRNSSKTNTAEFNQIKGLYQLAVAPALNIALSWAPGGPLLAPVYGGAMMGLTSPNAANEVAEMVVGPKTAKPKKSKTPGNQ